MKHIYLLSAMILVSAASLYTMDQDQNNNNNVNNNTVNTSNNDAGMQDILNLFVESNKKTQENLDRHFKKMQESLDRLLVSAASLHAMDQDQNNNNNVNNNTVNTNNNDANEWEQSFGRTKQNLSAVKNALNGLQNTMDRTDKQDEDLLKLNQNLDKTLVKTRSLEARVDRLAESTAAKKQATYLYYYMGGALIAVTFALLNSK